MTETKNRVSGPQMHTSAEIKESTRFYITSDNLGPLYLVGGLCHGGQVVMSLRSSLKAGLA